MFSAREISEVELLIHGFIIKIKLIIQICRWYIKESWRRPCIQKFKISPKVGQKSKRVIYNSQCNDPDRLKYIIPQIRSIHRLLNISVKHNGQIILITVFTTICSLEIKKVFAKLTFFLANHLIEIHKLSVKLRKVSP